MALISLQNVSKTYPPPRKGEPPVTALSEINLEIEAGEIFGIIGYSGAGKSTLVRLINALESSTSGNITVDGRQVSGVPERKRRQSEPTR